MGQSLLIFEASRSHSLIHTTVGRTTLDEWSVLPRDLYVTTHNPYNGQTPCPRRDSKPQSLQTEACNTDTTPTHPHPNSNTHRTKNNTTTVVFQQNSRKLLMMDMLMSETCWVHKKWNKIASDIKLVFYSSTIYILIPRSSLIRNYFWFTT